MNIKRTWIVASATIAVAGFAGAGITLASDDVHLNDPEQVPVVQLQSDDTAKQAVTADSGNTAASARSADSASDSPDDPGYVAPAPAPPPAPAPAPAPPAADSGDSPAPVRPAAPVYSDDSGNSGASADSAG